MLVDERLQMYFNKFGDRGKAVLAADRFWMLLSWAKICEGKLVHLILR